jgi:hypothetical protein
MYVSRGDWRIYFDLDRHTNPLRVGLAKETGEGLQTIVEWFPGPFDPAEDLLTQAVEMIENYEWKGVQLPLPHTSGQ